MAWPLNEHYFVDNAHLSSCRPRPDRGPRGFVAALACDACLSLPPLAVKRLPLTPSAAVVGRLSRIGKARGRSQETGSRGSVLRPSGPRDKTTAPQQRKLLQIANCPKAITADMIPQIPHSRLGPTLEGRSTNSRRREETVRSSSESFGKSASASSINILPLIGAC